MHTQPPLFYSLVLIAGVVVSLLVVLLLLSLVGGVLAVVVKARRKKKSKKTVESQSNEEDGPPKTEDTADNAYTCHNVRRQSSESSRHNEDAHDYATAENIFINPASATASFNTNVYDSANYSEVGQRLFAAGGEGHFEEFRVEQKWGGGGCHEDSVKSALSKQNISALKDSCKVAMPEELYAQPDKAKKKKNVSTEKDTEVTKKDVTVAAPCDDLYAQPDMTKKKDKRSQQHWEQESEERKLVSTTPLPYKKHVEVMQEADEDEEDIPEVPPPFDEEQYYNSRGGAGPPTQDGNYDYAVVDRQQK